MCNDSNIISTNDERKSTEPLHRRKRLHDRLGPSSLLRRALRVDFRRQSPPLLPLVSQIPTRQTPRKRNAPRRYCRRDQQEKKRIFLVS